LFPIHIHDGRNPLPETDIYYLIAQQGIFIYKKIGIVESLVPVQNISVLEPIIPMVKFHISKIPGSMLAKVVGLFRAVYEKYRAEAEVNIFYNEKTKKHRFIVPVQQVSGASVAYERKNPFEGEWVMLGTIHSHASMNAFHSGVDKDDEHAFDGLHITLGDMDEKDKFSIAATIASNGTRVQVNPLDYISGLHLVQEVKEAPRTSKYYKYIDGALKEVESTVSPIQSTKKYYTLKTSPKSYLFEAALLDNITEKKYEYSKYVHGHFGTYWHEYQDYFGAYQWWRDPRYMYEKDGNKKEEKPHPVFGPPPGVTPIKFPDRSTIESLLADEKENADIYIEHNSKYVPIDSLIDGMHVIDHLDDEDWNPCKDCIHRDEKLEWILEHATEIDEATDAEIEKLEDQFIPRTDHQDEPYFNPIFDEINRAALESIVHRKTERPLSHFCHDRKQLPAPGRKL
jgi:hypothetical protein